MKKGKTAKLTGLKTAKVLYGTVDSVNFKSLYLNIQTWVEPIKSSENWNRIVLNLSRAIKHTIHEYLDTKIMKENFIVDLDLRSSGLSVGKKSFLNLEINFYLNDETLNFKSKKLKDYLKKMSLIIFEQNFKNNEHFKLYLRKTSKEKELQTI